MLKKYRTILKDTEFSMKYMQIMNEMSYSIPKDIVSRDLLHGILESGDYSLDTNLKKLEKLITGAKTIFIFGGGPDSSEFLELFDNSVFHNLGYRNPLIIAIDGATELLFEKGIVPDIVFTDLDGIDIGTVSKKKFEHTLFVIHAHGDNINKIEEFKDFIINTQFLIGTTQNETKLPVINHGGFSDGDRALFLIGNFLGNNQDLFLIGYDFGGIVGKHSKLGFDKNMEADHIKLKKLKIGLHLTYEICLTFPCKTNLIELKTPSNPTFHLHKDSGIFKIIRVRNGKDLRSIIS
jgi:uncharacterized Rossmann fold enzyme